jgi:hypothetical protein
MIRFNLLNQQRPGCEYLCMAAKYAVPTADRKVTASRRNFGQNAIKMRDATYIFH